MPGSDVLRIINEERTRAAREFYESLRPVVSRLVNTGASQSAIVNELNLEGYTTINGKAWNIDRVKNLLKKLSLSTKYSPQ